MNGTDILCCFSFSLSLSLSSLVLSLFSFFLCVEKHVKHFVLIMCELTMLKVDSGFDEEQTGFYGANVSLI